MRKLPGRPSPKPFAEDHELDISTQALDPLPECVCLGVDIGSVVAVTLSSVVEKVFQLPIIDITYHVEQKLARPTHSLPVIFQTEL